MPDVREATRDDRSRVIATLTNAFASDAIIRFLFPDDVTYPDRAGAFFGHYFDVRLEGGEIIVESTVRGASLWNPPGGNRRGAEFVAANWARNVAPHLTEPENVRYEAFKDALEAITPNEDHWYLGLLGTEPASQRTGIARAVLTPILAKADGERTPVFLETAMPENVPFYDRFGFSIIEESDVEDGPHFWGLWRPPRS